MQTPRTLLFLASALLLPPLLGAAAAQDIKKPSGGPPPFDQLFNRTVGWVLDLDEVRTDLKLSREDVAKLEERLEQAMAPVRKKYDEEIAKLNGLSEADQHKQLIQINKRYEPEAVNLFVSVLSADQGKRLRQILLHSKGPFLFAEPEVQKTLKLTEEQKAKLVMFEKEATRERQDMIRQTKREDIRLHRAVKARWKAKILAIFTPEQKKLWDDLAGPPFKLPFEP
jgi:Spy/CpxP family protein refolding chaperone